MYLGGSSRRDSRRIGDGVAWKSICSRLRGNVFEECLPDSLLSVTS